MAEDAPKRICLKITGEALSSAEGIFSESRFHWIHQQFQSLAEMQKEVLCIIGGGNIFRGGNSFLPLSYAHRVGMLATLMNGLALKGFLKSQIPQLPIEFYSFYGTVPEIPLFNFSQVEKDLQDGKIVVVLGGSGQPYFTTDTATILRAMDIQADVCVKGTKVSGVYTKDPYLCPEAKRYSVINYEDFLSQRLGVMDNSAVLMAQQAQMPIWVYHFLETPIKDIFENKALYTKIGHREKHGIKESIYG